MKRIKTAAAVLLALMLLCGMNVSALAADNASLDFSQTGSITLTLEDTDVDTVSGGAVTLYQVATLYLDDGNMAYAYTDAFANCGIELNVENTSLAAYLAAWVSDDTPGTTQTVGSGGTVSFSGLDLGLYLIVQTTSSKNYETICPFVGTLPCDDGDTCDYTVDASPKVGAVIPITPTPTVAVTASPTPSTLAQTGQLNWPIPILAGIGIMLVILGVVMTVAYKKDHAK